MAGSTISTSQSKIASRSRGEYRRQVILQSTLDMIAEGGVDSVTHRRVAERAQIPLGSTTYYFESRDHLIGEAFNLYISDATEAMEATLKTHPVNSQKDFLNGLIMWAQREFANEAMLIAEYEMTLYAARNKEVARALAKWDKALKDFLISRLKSLKAQNIETAASVILNYMRGFEITSLSNLRKETEGELRAGLKLIVDSIFARP